MRPPEREASDHREQTVLEVGVRQMWPLAAILGACGLGLILLDVFTIPGVSIFTMLAVLCLVGAGVVLADSRSPTPVLRASSTGIRLPGKRETPWTDVRTLVLVTREDMSVDGPTTDIYLVLTSSEVTMAEQLRMDDISADPQVVGWTTLPFTVAGVDFDVLAARLKAVRPTLSMVDLRGTS